MSVISRGRAGLSAILVCAIDIGSTYSGYAYAEVKDVSEVILSEWNTHLHVSYKTSTSLLLDRSNKFVAFGYEADSKYAELVEDGHQVDYFYCYRALLDLRREVHLKYYSFLKSEFEF